jgi:hypothetical protein
LSILRPAYFAGRRIYAIAGATTAAVLCNGRLYLGLALTPIVDQPYW